jgi:hypothetical protein
MRRLALLLRGLVVSPTRPLARVADSQNLAQIAHGI